MDPHNGATRDVPITRSFRNEQEAVSSYEEKEIDLLELLSVLMANAKWIIAAVLIFAVAAFTFTRYFITPMYRSTGSIYVVSSKDSVINLSDFQMGNYLASDYEKVVYTWEVLHQTRQNLALDYSQDKLRGMVRVNNPANTRILEITVESPNAQEAAAIANELMRVVSNYVVNVMETEKPNILSEALVPSRRYSPSLTRNTMLGGVLGGFLSVLTIFVLFILDDKIKTPEDILKHAGLQTMAIIPKSGDAEASSARKSAKGSKSAPPAQPPRS